MKPDLTQRMCLVNAANVNVNHNYNDNNNLEEKGTKSDQEHFEIRNVREKTRIGVRPSSNTRTNGQFLTAAENASHASNPTSLLHRRMNNGSSNNTAHLVQDLTHRTRLCYVYNHIDTLCQAIYVRGRR